MARILVVDDQPVNRQFLVTLLGYADHDLLEAGDGAEALNVVRAEKPDLIITDILMPTMDGYEFVKRLRDDPETTSSAVIFYTAHYHKDEASHLAVACGVEHILTKPCEPDLVLRTVELLLSNPETSEPRAASTDFHRQHVRVITDKLSQTADELGVANQKLSALIDVGLRLASERDPRKLLDDVCRTARELFGAKHALLAVGKRDTAKDVFFCTSGLDSRAAAVIEQPALSSGIVGEAYRSRAPRRLKRVMADAAAAGLPAGFPAVESLLVAPIISLAHVYGWISLANKLGADEFGEEDERLLSILAAQVGRIYENGSLYKEVESHARDLAAEIEQRREAQQRVERLNRVHSVLSGINTLIVRERNRQRLFDEACRIAVDNGGFGIAWIDLVNPDSGEMVAAAAGGSDGHPPDGRRIFPAPMRDEDELLERAVTAKKPVWDNAVSPEARTHSERLDRAAALGYRSRIVLPLIVDAEVSGCLSLLTREPGFFTDEELKLLRSLADDISFAMSHIGQSEQLMYLAFFDGLTRLPNRELFLDRIDQHMRAANNEAPTAAVVLIDVERFRIVNESLGSGGGDELLRKIAGRLELTCGGKDTLGRVGPNRFGVLLRGVGDAADVVHAIESRLLACFWDAFRVNDTELRIAVKTGIAMWPGDGTDAHALLRNAEAALKKAKSTGHQYEFYSAELNARAAEVLKLETRLRKAVDKEEFVIHYQPKYDIVNGKICGLEALIRWQDPETGLVPPGKFIPLLEETGLIVDVGQWVLSRALQDYHSWTSLTASVPRIAVNVSAIEIQQRSFLDTVIEIIRRAGNTPEAIEFEITESLMMQDLERTVRVLNVVRGLGVSIAIDDFGTGYSSLNHIARLPVDKVKIDRSFVAGMTGNAEDMLIASTTILLAHSLGLRVIAEGVETDEQLFALKQNQCDEVQGYLFSRPVPKERIDEMLASEGDA